jgi:uncharacterized protein YdaU (DUF1376 family)
MSRQLKDPAFLFYSADFLTGTMTFSDDQVGKYMRALCIQHQKGELTEKELLKITGGDDDVMEKFERLENGKFVNKRLVTELQIRREKSQKNREKIDAWRKRNSNGSEQKNNGSVTVTGGLHDGYIEGSKLTSRVVEPKIESVSVSESESESESESTVRGGMGEEDEKHIVPLIVETYSEIFPDFIRDSERDPKSAYKIFQIISSNASVEDTDIGQFLDIWKNICTGIRDKKQVQFYAGNGLSTIANNLPTIISKIRTNANRKVDTTKRSIVAAAEEVLRRAAGENAE